MQLASQLPEGRDEALAVIEYLRQLVDVFLAPIQPDQARRGGIVALDAPAVSPGASPIRLASSNGIPSALPK